MPFTEFERLVRERILFPGRREESRGDCQWNALCSEERSKAPSTVSSLL